MEAGISAGPAPQVAPFAAVALMARTRTARAVFAPVRVAYPALGFGNRDALPTLRTDAAVRGRRLLSGPNPKSPGSAEGYLFAKLDCQAAWANACDGRPDHDDNDIAMGQRGYLPSSLERIAG